MSWRRVPLPFPAQTPSDQERIRLAEGFFNGVVDAAGLKLPPAIEASCARSIAVLLPPFTPLEDA